MSVKQFKELVARYYAGETLRALEASTGINRESIRGAMQRRGIERRDRSTRTVIPMGTVTRLGYKKFWMDGKRVSEHRIVVANRIGRELSPAEVVHHKNDNKLDNSDGNLALTDHQRHSREHANKRWSRRKRSSRSS